MRRPPHNRERTRLDRTSGDDHSPKFTRRTRRRSSWLTYVPLLGGAALLGTAYGAGALDGASKTHSVRSAASGERTSFEYCHVGGGYDCVVDGDTIWLKGEKIRIADIDAPETHDYRCSSEKELGDRATRRLHDLLESGTIGLRPIDRDRDIYGRKLRIVLVNGRSVGDALVTMGTVDGRGADRAVDKDVEASFKADGAQGRDRTAAIPGVSSQRQRAVQNQRTDERPVPSGSGQCPQNPRMLTRELHRIANVRFRPIPDISVCPLQTSLNCRIRGE
jgi:endonuclease YncB( thermonuclease family)